MSEGTTEAFCNPVAFALHPGMKHRKKLRIQGVDLFIRAGSWPQFLSDPAKRWLQAPKKLRSFAFGLRVFIDEDERRLDEINSVVRVLEEFRQLLLLGRNGVR